MSDARRHFECENFQTLITHFSFEIQAVWISLKWSSKRVVVTIRRTRSVGIDRDYSRLFALCCRRSQFRWHRCTFASGSWHPFHKFLNNHWNRTILKIQDMQAIHMYRTCGFKRLFNNCSDSIYEQNILLTKIYEDVHLRVHALFSWKIKNCTLTLNLVLLRTKETQIKQ